MRHLLICIIAVFCCIMPLSAQNEYKTLTDIPYHNEAGDYAQERCKLDIYYPQNVKNFATVIWYHGGGITGGSKFIPEQLKNSGIAVVAVNYRLLPKVHVQDAIDDTAASIAWVFNNIEAYGGDRSKIFLAGHSAGGYLIDMAILDKSYLSKYGIDADEVAGVFPFSAQVITHFNVRKEEGIGPLQPTIDSTAPLANMRVLPMPMFVFSGDRELELYGRYEEQAYFWRMMKLIGNESIYLYEFAGFDHGSMPTPGYPVMKRQIKAICEGKEITR